jgi:hypothetical protein
MQRFSLGGRGRHIANTLFDNDFDVEDAVAQVLRSIIGGDHGPGGWGDPPLVAWEAWS